MARRDSILFIIARSVLVACPLFLLQLFPQQGHADDEEKVVIVSGTSGADIITISIMDIINAAADIQTEISEKVEAAATGIDSLEGHDTITINAPVSAGAAANALLLQSPKKKTEAYARSTGVTAGEGDDSVFNYLALDILGSSLGAYGSVLEAEQPAPSGDDGGQDNKKEIDASVISKTELTGITTGDGVDLIENDGLLTINGLATSGGAAGKLTATVGESSTLKSKSESDASSTGIQAGDGIDTIINDGAFVTTATATSGALAVGLFAPGESTPSADKKVNIKTESNATSQATVTGIHGDKDELESDTDDSSPLGVNGLRVTYEKTATTVSGDDLIMNNGLLTGNASATSCAGSGSVSNKVNGSVRTEARAEAEATVTGINAGGGNDVIVNGGELLSTAIATSGALAVAVEVGAAEDAPPSARDPAKPPVPSKDKESKSSTDASTTAKATATGIAADGDAHSETVGWVLKLTDGSLVIDSWKVVEFLNGNDTVTNLFSINTLSLATSLTDSVGVTISSSGSAESKANAGAEAYGASVVTGSGDDVITNRGLLTTESTANATAVGVGLAVGQPPEDNGGSNGDEPPSPATPDKITSKSETNVTARAHGYGIDADGAAENVTTAGSLSIGADGLEVSLSRDRELASGNDTVNNSFAISVDASASADSTDASIQIEAVGSVNSEARATADALAAGIATGAGDDNIDNSGLLTVDADAGADSISFGLSATKPPEGETTDESGNSKKDTTNVKTDAGAAASASAAGIDAEGSEHLHSTAGSLQISGSGLDFSLLRETEALAGNDSVTNTGVMTTSAVARSGADSIGISINADGSVDSEASSRATARSGGILTGGGADTVDNQAVLSSDSTATARALSVSVSVAQPTDENGEKPSIWEKIKEKFASANSKANAEATSFAVGIDAEGDAGRQADSLNVSISTEGLLVDVDNEFTSHAGNDSITNCGALNATSTARTLAGAVDVNVETEGTAWSETNATARAGGGGILTGGGADIVNNTGLLTVLVDAEAGSVAVSFTQPDGLAVKSKADSKAVAQATATGIGTDSGLASELHDTSLTVGPDGIEFTRHSEAIVSAEADTVINTGAVVASALTLSGASDAAVSMDGAAKADVTAKSTSHAIAVDGGGGGDFIDNEGYLITTANAISGALGIGFGQKSEEKSKTKVEVEAGATSGSRAIGISGDSGANDITDMYVSIDSNGLDTYYMTEQTASVGDDIIANRGRIETHAMSATGGLGVSVSIDGAAKADVNATSRSQAAAVEGGGGDDRITSSGDVNATADADAIALSVGVGKKTSEDSSAKTKVEAGSASEAIATGIAGDGGQDDTSRSVSVTIDDSGLLAEYVDQTVAAAGNDEIINSGAVTSDATATSGAVSGAVTIDGAARADANSSATARAAGLDTGAGSDQIDNSGALSAGSYAESSTLNVAVSSDGRAVTNAGLIDGGNKAEAYATGITSAGGQYLKSTTANTFIDFNSIAVDVLYEAVTDGLSGDGADVIINSGSLAANSTAFAPEVTAGITGEGLAVSIGRTQAESSASAIQAGNLGDSIDNSGNLIVDAMSTAVLANVAVAGKGLAVATNAVWDGGTRAGASATGIDADSGGLTTKTVTARANSDVAYVRYKDAFQSASGDDNVVNSGRIDASAVALAPSLSVAVEPGKENKTGIAAAVSTSSADANTTAIRGGDGDDKLDNSSLLNATASATALSANVAVVNKGVAAAADAVWDGGTKAEASATGIAGDGGDRSRMTYLSIGTDDFTYEKTGVAADGVDNINNSGEINADATANAASIGVAVAAKGIGAATSTATAESRAAAIDAGSEGSVDGVYSSGKLTADSTARAAAASVSVTNEGLAVSADSVWDGGTRATAEARGIDVGAGGETLTNDGRIDASADAETASASIAASMKGVAGSSSTSTGKADAIAIDASAGDDDDAITNNAALTADATSLAAAASVSVVNQGLPIASGAVWDGGTKSIASARGIDVGDGVDTIDNTGTVTVSSLSAAAEAAIGVAVQGVAAAVATSTSEATAVAIHAGDDSDAAADTVVNSGDLEASARIRNKYFENEAENVVGGVSAAVSLSNAGVSIAGGAVWDGGTKAIADARGIDLGAGADVVDNSGNISTISDALVSELAASVSVSGVAGAVATSTGESSATAIHTGSGNAIDTVFNSGDLTSTSDATAISAAVSVTNAGLAVAGGAVWDGGTKGISQARGIYVGEGADVIDNSGHITAVSTGSALEVAAAISVSGVAGATATSTGQSTATAIDASEGDDADSVINSGDLLATSTANAATSTATMTNAGLAVAAGAVWDGGTTATSEGRGIDVGAGMDVVENSGAITAESDARAAELGVSVAVTGVAGAIATSTGESSTVAIDTGAEDDDEDTVINSGDLTVNSDALAATATVSVTTAGAAVAGGADWEGGTKANSQARGIEVGEGADIVNNSGNVDIWSNSVAAEAAVAVAVAGVAGGIATATSVSDASAIDTGDGVYVDAVSNSGDLVVISHALAATTSVSVTTAGVAVAAGDVWDGGTNAKSSAHGIEVGEGGDNIDNQGDVTSEAFAESASANVSVAVAGVAGAIATSTVVADSTALDAGAGAFDDTIVNSGDLSSLSSAITASAAVSFTAAGVAVAGDTAWEGGTSSAALSQGMALGAGNDSVINEGEVLADSISSATGSSVAISVLGVAAAITSADATAESIGINAGAGNDTIDSHDKITASSFANGNTITNSDTKFGVSAAGNSAWDGGAKSAATSSGVVGDSGTDVITNSGEMDIDAAAVSTSTAVTFTVGGVSASISTSTADAKANAIDGGEDDDVIENTGSLTVDSSSNAISANLALAGIGVAVAGDSVWDGGTTSGSTASGISGGAGNDFIRSGMIDNLPTALATNIFATAGSLVSTSSVSVTGAGISGAISTGTSNADARAIDAGTGNDAVINASDVTGTADADAYSVSVALTGGGGAGASDAFWDGGTKANADAYGIDGGSGIDQISNLAGVTADASSNTLSAAIAASFGGGLSGAVAASTSTANATGINGADGEDTILSSGDVTSKALAEAQGVSVSMTGGGVAVSGAFSDNTTVADATATGLSGGKGADTLSNESSATITVNSDAHALETQVALNLAGITAASANTTATATSTGFDGGSDNDLMMNAGRVQQISDAASIARSIQLTGFGAGVADANSSSQAISQGFVAGYGDDALLNSGSVDLVSEATSTGQSIAVTQVGANIGKASAESLADSAGFAGDAGADWLENSGDLTIGTYSEATAASISAAQLGYNLGEANSDAGSNVTGISGGIGTDVLLNSGVIDIDAAADATATSIAGSQFGFNVGKSNTIAEVDITGLAGGEGGDMLINTEFGVIDLLAMGDARSIGVSITVGGVANAEAGSQVLAGVIGMQGDVGDDEILNEGLLGVNTQLHSTSTGASVSFFGVSTARAGAEIESVATGIAGGDGADMIVNTGSIRIGPAEGATGDDHWMSILRGTAESAGLAGLSSAEASAVASTTSTGMDGGLEDDYIRNEGNVTVIANSLSETGAQDIQIFGKSDAAGEAGAFTLATGLDGGLGDDVLETLGSLSVQAESQLVQDGTSFTFGGAGNSGSALEAATDAIGISGGAGQDQIRTDGKITVDADSVLVSKGGGTTVFGGSAAAGESGATTRATGIDGGGEDDIIDNAADITLTASSDVSLNNSSYTFGGSGNTSGTLAATTSVDGILGGDGLDMIFNSGDIDIFAESALTSRGGSEATFGGSASATISGAITHAAGIAGGYADDIIENALASTIDVTAKTTVSANSVAYTFGGGSGTDAILAGEAFAEGLSGDDGNDQLRNDGFLKVLADATLKSTGGAKSTFSGGNDATGKAEARSHAVGMGGGEGDDDIVSSGFVDVQARTVAEARNDASSSVSFTSEEVSGSVSDASAEATGLDGAAGGNFIQNSGNLSVSARSIGYALSYANGASFSFSGDGEARAESVALAVATGISSGDGDNTVLSEHQMNVMAEAVTTKLLETTITVYRLQGNDDDSDQPGESGPETVHELPATVGTGTEYPVGTLVYCTDPDCIVNPDVNEAGNYYQVVSTGGDSPVFSWEAFAVVDSLPAIDEDYPEGTIVACTAIDCREDPAIKASATYYQVVSTGGDSPIFSWERFDGLTIEVDVDVIENSFSSYAAANGNGLDGDGTATARGKADARATGVSLGDGDNRLENRDQLTVEARAEAVFNASADGDAFGDARGTSDASSMAHAVGIRLGDGNNGFLNTVTGNISVTASPVAQALTDVTGGDICIWFFGWWCGGGGDGIGTANASFEAMAIGLIAGDGDNTITNNGTITVIAKPKVRLDERIGAEFVADVRRENVEGIEVLADAGAVGIQTGDGNNTVVNNGIVSVEAYDLLSGCETQSCRDLTIAKGIDGNAVAATGVQTGSGNDIVVNNGSITALEFRNNVASEGTGIETGAGDDQLVLGGGSTVTGSVELGDGNDSLTLIGNPVVKNAAEAVIHPLAGAGVDTLTLQGTGSFGGVPDSFEHAVKTAPGTFALPELPAVQSLVIDGGTLELGSGYDFPAGSSFSTYVHSDSDYGKLLVNGSATLDGAIAVEKRGGTYVNNGSRYSVLEATGSLGNSFADVTLPAQTPLLHYDLEQTANTVDTVATAGSFSLVAGNPLYRQIARNLDRIATDATGDLAEVLGTLQSLESGFDRAFASASPDSYLVGGHSTVATGLQMMHLLQNHLGSSRAMYRHSLQGQATASGNVSFAYNNGIGAIGLSTAPVVAGHHAASYMLAANEYSGTGVSQAIPQPASARSQAWIAGVKAGGDYDEVDGYTDFDTDSRIASVGYDYRLSKHLIVGAILGYSNTDLDMGMAGADGDIEAWSGGAYASWFNDKAYLEGGISYASQTFDNQRTVVIGTTKRRARSDHDGNVWMGFLGSGYRLAFDDWSLEPYGSLYYFNAQEDGFRETGADSLNQIIDDRDTEALVGEFGARVARLQRLGKGTIDWHASLGLNHDFDIDDASIAYGYAGAPGTVFEIDDRDLDSNSTVIGAGITYTSGRSTISLDYRRQHNDDYDNDAVYAGMVVRF